MPSHITHDGPDAVAAYLGVTTSALHGWCKNPPPGFVEPEVCIGSRNGKITGRAWSPHQIRDLRSWYADKRGMDDATARRHWLLVDRDNANRYLAAHGPLDYGQDDVPENQQELFSVNTAMIPEQKRVEE